MLCLTTLGSCQEEANESMVILYKRPFYAHRSDDPADHLRPCCERGLEPLYCVHCLWKTFTTPIRSVQGDTRKADQGSGFRDSIKATRIRRAPMDLQHLC